MTKEKTRNNAIGQKERPRNSGQWTESRYESFITSCLRSAVRRWPPKWECLREAFLDIRRNKKSKRQAKHYLCAICRGAFPSTEVQIDHRVPIGHCDTWDEFIERLFVEKDKLQCLCKPCHKLKSKTERKDNENKKGG